MCGIKKKQQQQTRIVFKRLFNVFFDQIYNIFVFKFKKKNIYKYLKFFWIRLDFYGGVTLPKKNSVCS